MHSLCSQGFPSAPPGAHCLPGAPWPPAPKQQHPPGRSLLSPVQALPEPPRQDRQRGRLLPGPRSQKPTFSVSKDDFPDYSCPAGSCRRRGTGAPLRVEQLTSPRRLLQQPRAWAAPPVHGRRRLTAGGQRGLSPTATCPGTVDTITHPVPTAVYTRSAHNETNHARNAVISRQQQGLLRVVPQHEAQGGESSFAAEITANTRGKHPRQATASAPCSASPRARSRAWRCHPGTWSPPHRGANPSLRPLRNPWL